MNAKEILKQKIREANYGIISLEVPSGTIDVAGRIEICNYLYGLGASCVPSRADDSEPTWYWMVGGKGEYVGAFPKRIAKWLYQEANFKIKPEDLAKVGDLAARYCNRDKVSLYRFDITQNFDWDSGDFGDSGSCFWTCRSNAKDMLHNAGAYAIRFYDSYDRGIARCWIVPYNDFLVTFNGYGLGDGALAHSRILANFLGIAYKKIDIRNNYVTDGTLWINSGTGYAVGQWKNIAEVTKVDFEIDDLDLIRCTSCNGELDEDHITDLDGNPICEDCWNENYFSCQRCGDAHSKADAYTGSDGYDYCEHCFDALFAKCHNCDDIVCHIDAITTQEKHVFCCDCAGNECYECEECGEYTENGITSADDLVYCNGCFSNKEEACEICEETVDLSSMIRVNDKVLCEECKDKYLPCSCGDGFYVKPETCCSDCAVDKMFGEEHELCVAANS